MLFNSISGMQIKINECGTIVALYMQRDLILGDYSLDLFQAFSLDCSVRKIQDSHQIRQADIIEIFFLKSF